MKIRDFLDSLPENQRERALGRIEGMQMSMRICRNRAEDNKNDLNRSMEAAMCAELVRLVQVQIGAGNRPFGDLTPAELDEIWRIY